MIYFREDRLDFRPPFLDFRDFRLEDFRLGACFLIFSRDILFPRARAKAAFFMVDLPLIFCCLANFINLALVILWACLFFSGEYLCRLSSFLVDLRPECLLEPFLELRLEPRLDLAIVVFFVFWFYSTFIRHSNFFGTFY
jgi:hypothetical protein